MSHYLASLTELARILRMTIHATNRRLETGSTNCGNSSGTKTTASAPSTRSRVNLPR